MNESVPVWSRQPCDTDESWPAYVAYRDQLPPRRMYGNAAGSEKVRQWRTDHCWDDRVRRYDTWRDEILLGERGAALRQTSREIAAEHMAVLKDLRTILSREAEKFLRASEDALPIISNVGQLAKLADFVVDADRLIRGEVTERTASEELDLTKYTVAELKDLQKLLLKGKQP